MKVKFYLSFSGRSPVEAFLADLSHEMRSDFVDTLVLLEDGQSLSMPLSRNLSSIHKGLHELRLKDRTGAYRFFILLKKLMEFILFMLLKRRPKNFRKKKLTWS